MKLVFNFCLLCSSFYYSTVTYAKIPVLISGNFSEQDFITIEKILIKKFHFPKILILKELGPCVKNEDAILQICLKENLEIEILNMQKSFMKNNFKTFMEMTNDEQK